MLVVVFVKYNITMSFYLNSIKKGENYMERILNLPNVAKFGIILAHLITPQIKIVFSLKNSDYCVC